MKIVFKNKYLAISVVLFIVSFWMSTYVFLPYFAIGGLHYMGYDLTNPVNIIINIVLPSLIFLASIIFANYYFKKSLTITHNMIIWIILIILLVSLIGFLIYFGVMVIFEENPMVNWAIGYWFGFISILNFLIWSIIALRNSVITFKKKKES